MAENQNNSTSTLPDTGTTVESYFFETLSTVKELVYTWTIRNVSNTYMQTTGSIRSSTITTKFGDNSWRWYLLLYPNSYDSSCQNWLSLTVQQRNIAQIDQQVYLIIYIIDKLKKEHECYKNFFTFSVWNLNKLDVLNLIMKNRLSNLMINGNLKIACKMYINVNCNYSSVASNPVLKVEESTTGDQRLLEFDDFEKLLDNEKFSDIKLIAGETQFFAHKNILATRSKVFAAMFSYDMKENNENAIIITDICSEAMKEVLRFIYTGKVSDIKSISGELLAAADKYELQGLKIMCEETIINSLSKDSLNDIIVLVDRHDVEKLRNATIDFITLHANELSSTDSFKAAIKTLSSALLSDVIEAMMLKI